MTILYDHYHLLTSRNMKRLFIILHILLIMNKTLALTDASIAGESNVVGKTHPGDPPSPTFKDPDRWPFADVTAPPKAEQKRPTNGSDCDDEETIPATCGYYARSSKGCSRPRLCRDCLHMMGCMINQFGACVNMSMHQYEPSLDYHKAFEFNLTGSSASERNVTLRYHFPAGNATYCPTTDPTCIECKNSVFAGDVSDSRFCVGANNCICIASCETTRWEQLAGGMRCGPPPKPKAFAAGPLPPNFKPNEHERREKEESSSGGVSVKDVWTMAGIPALVVVVGLLVVRSHKIETKRRTQAALEQQQNAGFNIDGGNNIRPRETTTGGTRLGRLNLTGWQASRQPPKEPEEKVILDSTCGVSPKHHFVDLLDTRPSVNPDVKVLVAPVMAAVVVEASAPPMSPQHDDGMEEPSAPSFDSDFTYDQEDLEFI